MGGKQNSLTIRQHDGLVEMVRKINVRKDRFWMRNETIRIFGGHTQYVGPKKQRNIETHRVLEGEIRNDTIPKTYRVSWKVTGQRYGMGT